jgi:hypothetical protein
MKMSEHTPGLWVAKKYKISCGYRVTTTPDTGDVSGDICNVMYGFGATTEAQCTANARLIAASPLMLHELYAAAAQIEALGGDARTQRAAISKAEGKQ